MHAPAEIEAYSAEERPRGRVVLNEVADELRHVLCRAALPRSRQPVSIHEARGVQPELDRLGVHPLDEGLLGAREVLGDGGGGIVGGGDGHAFQERAKGDAVARPESHPIARRLRRPPTDRDRLFPRHASGLEVLAGEVERHQLHQARRRVVELGVLGVDDLALGVEQQYRLRAQRQEPIVLHCRCREREADDKDAECNQDARAKHHEHSSQAASR